MHEQGIGIILVDARGGELDSDWSPTALAVGAYVFRDPQMCISVFDFG